LHVLFIQEVVSHIAVRLLLRRKWNSFAKYFLL